ncbi:MAG: hypothetical protein ABSA13_18330, partial [Beijerinckiaceae bacterium]
MSVLAFRMKRGCRDGHQQDSGQTGFESVRSENSPGDFNQSIAAYLHYHETPPLKLKLQSIDTPPPPIIKYITRN